MRCPFCENPLSFRAPGSYLKTLWVEKEEKIIVHEHCADKAEKKFKRLPTDEDQLRFMNDIAKRSSM